MTQNNPDWLTNLPKAKHANTAQFQNGQTTVPATAEALPMESSITKSTTGQGNFENTGLPYFEYTVEISGVSSLPAVIDDVFDAENLEVKVGNWAQTDSIIVSGKENDWDDIKGGAVVVTPTGSGATFTITEEAAPTKEDGSPYSRYFFKYVLKVKDQDAYDRLINSGLYDGKINVDDNIKAWVDMAKEQVDAGYTGTADLWSDDWSKGFYPDGKVFAYFGPAWLINFCMNADDPESVAGQGGWGATTGPQGFYWGGTWICAANGTDNPALVADIIRKLTTDETIMTDIVKADNDFVNNKPAMEAAATDDSYAFDVLGGQNPLAMFCEGADKIDLSNLSEYDQGCNESFQAAMKDYFEGNTATYEEALDAFYTSVTEKYPELSY